MPQVCQYQINKRAIRDIKAVHAAGPDALTPGQILVRIDSFALTANNITYAATGEVLGYWKFFPCQDPSVGLMPVWGFATVEQSACAAIAVGERLFGFFPMASHAVLWPGEITPQALTDAAAHRHELPVVYNQYRRLAAGADQTMDDYLALLYPLFATSFLINDYLQENNWFGAQQLIIASASSKTAIGLMQLTTQQANHPTIVGLTSSGNADFAEKLGCCDQVVCYGDLRTKIQPIASMLVDIAGNIDVREALHTHLDEKMVYSCAVGTSHWDKFRDAGPMPGARPKFFFAPAQSEKRRKEWGAAMLAARIAEAWQQLSLDSRRWMTVQHGVGEQNVLAVYQAMANGTATPDQGHMLTP